MLYYAKLINGRHESCSTHGLTVKWMDKLDWIIRYGQKHTEMKLASPLSDTHTLTYEFTKFLAYLRVIELHSLVLRPHPQEGKRVWRYSSHSLVLLTQQLFDFWGVLCNH